MKTVQIRKSLNAQRGYTLLFSVLTAVLVLGVAAFIMGVARKQYILSSTARDSLISIYNADSGVECFVQRNEIFFGDDDTLSLLYCNGTASQPGSTGFEAVSDITTVPGYDPFLSGANQNRIFNDQPIYTSSATLYLQMSDGCALLKIWSGTGKNGSPATVVNSRGYNKCNGSGPADSPRTVERAMQFTVQ